MAVRQLPSGKWLADVVVGRKWDGRDDRRTKVCPTQAKAKKEERRLLLLKEQAQGRVTMTMTLQEFVDEVYWPAKAHLRHNTRMGYERDLRLRILPALGHLRLDEIRKPHIQRLISSCPTRKVATNTRETLSAVLGEAMQSELIPTNPAGLRFRYPLEAPHAPDHYGEWLSTFAEHMPLLEYVASRYPGQAEERIVVLGLCHGLRKGEVFGLDWESIEEEGVRVSQSYTVDGHGAYLTEPKTARAYRLVPSNAWAKERIASWVREEGKPVVRGRDGGRMHPKTGSARIRKMIARAHDEGVELPGVTIYSMRHSFATACLDAGMPIEKLSAILGHVDATTTRNIYVKPKERDLVDAMGIVDEAYGRVAKGTGPYA